VQRGCAGARTGTHPLAKNLINRLDQLVSSQIERVDLTLQTGEGFVCNTNGMGGILGLPKTVIGSIQSHHMGPGRAARLACRLRLPGKIGVLKRTYNFEWSIPQSSSYGRVSFQFVHDEPLSA